MARHLSPTELADELKMKRRDVIAACMQMGVPIFQGRIDKDLFVSSLNRFPAIRGEANVTPGVREWVHLTAEQLTADLSLREAIDRFSAPASRAGEAAASWLKGRALREVSRIATYVLIEDREVDAFYSLGMSEVELTSSHRKAIEASHPRQGAVLILWLARASDAEVDGETILKHAVGVGQVGARNVGAAVIALDPFDADTERMWRERFGFRRSRTRRPDADGEERSRLWMPLFPEG